MSTIIRFCQGELWQYKGKKLRFERELGNRYLYFLVEPTLAPFQIEDTEGRLSAPNVEWAITAFADGSLRRLIDPQASHCSRRLAAQREYDSETASQIDPRYSLRRFVLRGLDEFGHCELGDKAIARALTRLWGSKLDRAVDFVMPPVRTVRRWLETRGSSGERRTSQLVSLSGRVPRRRRLHPELVGLLQAAAVDYWTSRERSIADAFALFTDAIRGANADPERLGHRPTLEPPSIETLRREIRKLECFDTYAAKYGQKKAETRFKGNGKGLTASRLLRLGCMDHTLLDTVAVIDATSVLPLGRPWLTVLIDVRTRCVVGFVITFLPPSLYAALECIKRANRPKLRLDQTHPNYPVLVHIFGKFDEIVVDNGWEFSGASFEDANADVGTTVRWAPIKSPTYKAVVERFFGTLNSLLNSKTPGSVLKPELLRELDYDPYKTAVLTLEELEQLVWSAISYYHIDEHSTLHRPPASLWEEEMAAHGIDVIGDDSQLDKMAGAVESGRRLSRSGVMLHGLQFHDPAVTTGLLEDLIAYEPVRRQRRRGSATVTVKVKFNPENLAEIHVWNAKRSRYVTLPCVDEEYTRATSLWQHEQLRKWTQAKGLAFSSEADRQAARAALIREIEDLAPDLKVRQRRAIARLQDSARIQDLLGSHIEVALAPARHDGMAPTIEQEPLASHRNDGGSPPTRPPRGGRRVSKATARRETILETNTPENEEEVPSAIDWKGFKL